MYRLRVQQQKIIQTSLRLKERDKVLFQTCVNALKANNREMAAICANELAEIRKLISFLQQVELALERVILRLETIKELSDIVIDLKPVLRTIQGISRQLSEILPEVASEINEINNVLIETIHSTKISDEISIPVNRVTPAGEQILSEVESFLEKQIREKLPEPPATLETSSIKQSKAEIKQMVALAASCSQSVSNEIVDGRKYCPENLISFRKAEIQEISLKVGNLEEALLEYVKRSGGEIDLIRCSRDLGAPCEEVEKALRSLGAKGKVKIEVKR
jgi:division protein CdvB (Snf7/Vps24/ESCRT-III family)